MLPAIFLLFARRIRMRARLRFVGEKPGNRLGGKRERCEGCEEFLAFGWVPNLGKRNQSAHGKLGSGGWARAAGGALSRWGGIQAFNRPGKG